MQNRLKKFFYKKSILITGGTGSFGSKAVEMLLKFNPDKIIIFSRDELKQQEMNNKFQNNKLRFFLGDIRDLQRIQFALRKIDYVIHAAALKQVPKAEYDPYEFVKTNIVGTQNVISASIHNNVKKVMLVSTDKAVSPINMYGSTKLCAERMIVSSNNIIGHDKIQFSVSRYGNVINSRGSLLPIIMEKIKKKQNLPLTHKDMTRFFITIEDGVKFTLTNFLRMKGGEIFIPKIKSYKIIDILKHFSQINKLKIKNIGLREGEKIHEALFNVDESKYLLSFKNFYLIQPSFLLGSNRNYKKTAIKEKGISIRNAFSYTSENFSNLNLKDKTLFSKFDR